LQDPSRLAHRERHLRLRAQMLGAVRGFFVARDYLEVETPQLISAPAPELHIEVIPADGRYLHPSPELCMKRLLAAGFSKIFQISRCFRRGERGDRHLPEFTLLEWYRSGIDYQDLMEECEVLIRYVAERLGRGPILSYNGRDIDLRGPWERLSVQEAFHRYTALTPDRALAEDGFDQVLVEAIEPRLGMARPTFLYDYPAPLASLARLKPGNTGVAERFEMYIAGMELANGFSELTHSGEQRERFEAERQQRAAAGKEVHPLPVLFLQSMEEMPASAGIALGVDRLAMVFCGASRIDDVVAFTPEEA